MSFQNWRTRARLICSAKMQVIRLTMMPRYLCCVWIEWQQSVQNLSAHGVSRNGRSICAGKVCCTSTLTTTASIHSMSTRRRFCKCTQRTSLNPIFLFMLIRLLPLVCKQSTKSGGLHVVCKNGALMFLLTLT